MHIHHYLHCFINVHIFSYMIFFYNISSHSCCCIDVFFRIEIYYKYIRCMIYKDMIPNKIKIFFLFFSYKIVYLVYIDVLTSFSRGGTGVPCPPLLCLIGAIFIPSDCSASGGWWHRWELPGNYPVFTVVMVIYHYVERIWRILVTPIFTYNIYDR